MVEVIKIACRAITIEARYEARADDIPNIAKEALGGDFFTEGHITRIELARAFGPLAPSVKVGVGSIARTRDRGAFEAGVPRIIGSGCCVPLAKTCAGSSIRLSPSMIGNWKVLKV